MITCQCAEAMPTYAPQSSYLTPIPSANIERGVAPLDSLPADWWNWLWNNITLNEGRIVQFINSVFSEINSVLSAAGVTPSTASTTDLRDAIQKLATTVATSAVPGSVLSSTLSGKLRVIADGTASINGLGTPDQLVTTSKEVVSAINEVLALAQGKAPTSHASPDTTYGVGTTQQYGHVKLCDGASAVTSACGVAATPAAVKSVADTLASYQSVNNTAVAGKAPTLHASANTTYGVGTTQRYGHVKVTEGCGLAISCGTISLNAPGYNCVGTVTAVCFNGTKYTPSSGVVSFNASGANCTGTVTAVCYNGTKYTPSSGVVNLGNAPTDFPGYGTAICPLNGDLCCASSAGTSNLVARADHVHAMPSCIGNGDSCICLTDCAANIVSFGCVSLRSNGRGLNIYANARRYLVAEPIGHGFCTVYVPEGNRTLTDLHNAIGGNKAAGLGFCICGNGISGYVTGMEWWSFQGQLQVSMVYRVSMGNACLCSTTLSPPQSTTCRYCMKGMLTVL